MIVLNNLDARILYHLRDKGPLSPTLIGHVFGFDYDDASAHVTKPLRRLLALGLIRKESKNKRIVEYRCIKVLPPMVIAPSNEKVAIPKSLIKDIEEPVVSLHEVLRAKVLQPVHNDNQKINDLLIKLDEVRHA
ncbi:hypothetical protein Cp1R7AA1_176 [Mesorhizobium phage Cp1R7A-A1]|nr:hypothetical protein Cp1R7AA1_176 [Mesorhizobium phage Cp1R7A-A1]